MIYRLEYQEIYKGFHLVVMFVGAKRCGYIGLPEGNKNIGKDYNLIDVEIHGGLTFGEERKMVSFSLNDYPYYIGFDCEHYMDGADIKAMKNYGASEREIEIWSHLYGEIRTKDFVIDELHNAVEQLLKEKK